MTNFEQSLIEQIEYLLALKVGDISRLKNIEKSIIENKKLYNSDIQYVEKLVQKNPSKLTERFDEDHLSTKNKSCLVCSEEIEVSAKFCSFCGASQNQTNLDSDDISSGKANRKNKPFRKILNFHAYQILGIIGGLAALIPILIGISNIERVFELAEFYTGRDFSSFDLAIISSGVVSYILCLLVIVISFLIKEPKKVGRFLIYLSFGILIFSILSGAVGFVIILFAGILALKKDVKK
jgi:hypothetical protein